MTFREGQALLGRIVFKDGTSPQYDRPYLIVTVSESFLEVVNYREKEKCYTMAKNISVVKSDVLGSKYDPRYVVVNTDTGEILDDAQGYGYKTIRKAYAAYAYKTRDKSENATKKGKERSIREWCRKHKNFMDEINAIAFEIAKGSGSPSDKLDKACISRLLDDFGIEDTLPCIPITFLKFWRTKW